MRRFFSLLLIPFLASAPAAFAEGKPDNLSIVPGEELTYELRWSIFPVGMAKLAIEEATFDSKDAYKISMRAATNSFADKFFKVRNHSVSYVDPEITRSLYWKKKQHEGDHQRDVEVTFDWDEMIAQYTNYGEPWEPLKIQEGSFDPLSIVFAFRKLPTEEGEMISIPTTNGKRMMMTDIKVVGREKVKTPLGKFDAVVVVPDTKNLGGVFKKSDDSEIRFWVSDDDRRIILKMQSEVAVGSFWAELVDVSGPGSENYQKEDDDGGGYERRSRNLR